MMQGDQNTPVQLMIRECIVSTGRITVAVNKDVVSHILVTKPARFEDRTGSTLEVHALPAPIEKPMIVGIVRVAADKVRACAGAIEPDDIRQGGFEKEGLVWRAEVIEVQKPIDIALGHVFRPSPLGRDNLGFGHGLKIAL